MWRVDFHIHTFASPDSLTPVQEVLAAARRRELNMVAITDHNTIQGALEARALAPEQVIVGEEIMTTQGELLAYFLKETVPAGLSPEETVARIRAQGGVVAVAHPFDARRKGHWRMEDLQRIAPLVDAIEGLNARCFSRQANLEAQEFAQAWGLPVLAGSDAHSVREVGRVVTVLPRFASAAELKDALTASRLEGRISRPTVMLASLYAKLHKRWRLAGRA